MGVVAWARRLLSRTKQQPQQPEPEPEADMSARESLQKVLDWIEANRQGVARGEKPDRAVAVEALVQCRVKLAGDDPKRHVVDAAIDALAAAQSIGQLDDVASWLRGLDTALTPAPEVLDALPATIDDEDALEVVFDGELDDGTVALGGVALNAATGIASGETSNATHNGEPVFEQDPCSKLAPAAEKALADVRRVLDERDALRVQVREQDQRIADLQDELADVGAGELATRADAPCHCDDDCERALAAFREISRLCNAD